ncbi:hypothetical protein FBU59_002352 [Linderina macrospora]|uniref:Uncharacterized protein n=1 Tax=Linderina macrospora TaxID=4868 RepID=A0ACC1JBG6_9FUNG|nr:hypothetical protein FBU59_002352 [Linderina macrospora]
MPPRVTVNYLSHYGHYANAAYHRFDNWTTCEPCQTHDDISAFNLTFSWSTTALPKASFSRGYMGVHMQRQEIVIVYRGTTHLLDVLGDSQVIQTQWPEHVGESRVHSGFVAAYLASREHMRNALKVLLEMHPTFDVYFVGHSLGGAQATLAFTEFMEEENRGAVRLVTFGAPRVGNGAFAKYVNSQLLQRSNDCSALRVTNERDLVPHLPAPLVPGHYVHGDQEFWVHEDELVECRIHSDGDPGEDPECAAGTFPLFRNMHDHMHYPGLTLTIPEVHVKQT